MALIFLVFEKIALLCTHFGDRQTDKQMRMFVDVKIHIFCICDIS